MEIGHLGQGTCLDTRKLPILRNGFYINVRIAIKAMFIAVPEYRRDEETDPDAVDEHDPDEELDEPQEPQMQDHSEADRRN